MSRATDLKAMFVVNGLLEKIDELIKSSGRDQWLAVELLDFYLGEAENYQ